jgi:hypothetical protein
MERGSLGDALASIPATEGVVLPEIWTAKRINSMATRFQEWLLPVYGFSRELEVRAAQEASASEAAAAAGAEDDGGGAEAGGNGLGGGGGGAGATPAQAAPGSAAAGPGPNTVAGASTLAGLQVDRPGGGAAEQPRRGVRRVRFEDGGDEGSSAADTMAAEGACKVCRNTVDPIHLCLKCGAFVHAPCGHTLVEGYGKPVICYGCLGQGATVAEVAAMAAAPAEAALPSGREHLRRKANT